MDAEFQLGLPPPFGGASEDTDDALGRLGEALAERRVDAVWHERMSDPRDGELLRPPAKPGPC